MGFQISRLYDFQPGTKILSSQIDAEFNQLVQVHNNLDTSVDNLKNTLGTTGSTEIGIISVPGLDSSVRTLQQFIATEVAARLAHTNNTDNPHGVTTAQIGLDKVLNVKQATETDFLNHQTNTSNPHGVTKAQLGLGEVDNTSDIQKPISNPQQEALNMKVDKVVGKSLIPDTYISKLENIAPGAEVNVQSDWGQSDTTADDYIKNKPVFGNSAFLDIGTNPGNIPILDSSGKLALTIIPSVAITSTSVVDSLAQMLALTAEVGDVAIRTDVRKTYILRTHPSTEESNWQEILTPTDLVQSVCGKVGVVSLNALDVGALSPGDIVDSLDSSSTIKTLSAKQGKVLKESLGSLTLLNGFFTGSSRDNLVLAINHLLARVGTDSFDTQFGSIADLVSAVNFLATNKVKGNTIKEIKLEGSQLYVKEGSTWMEVSGPQGLQGKGYNPRGKWTSGVSYIHSNTQIDVVEHGGSSYYCKSNVTSSSSPDMDTTHWGLLALSGTAAQGSQIPLTGYTLPGQYSPVFQTDSVNQAIGKIERALVMIGDFIDEVLKPQIIYSHQLTKFGLTFDLGVITQPIDPNLSGAQYNFTFGPIYLVDLRDSDLTYLFENAKMKVSYFPDEDNQENRAKLRECQPIMKNLTISTEVDNVRKQVTLSGSFVIEWTIPPSTEIKIYPQLIIPSKVPSQITVL